MSVVHEAKSTGYNSDAIEVPGETPRISNPAHTSKKSFLSRLPALVNQATARVRSTLQETARKQEILLKAQAHSAK
ncbi:hypothetical protein VNI00_010037 [Paramarasmius palmivorus]|uniref:Uncharacterized protein n=1 Tax=Paramarasmius palmivorus TaxID=297713 RepID=A0AAW0CMP6_9AGAR